jgi:hypothetical protein
VRRLQAVSPDEQPRVFAYKSEVDTWWNERQTKQSDKPEKEVPEEERNTAAVPASPIAARTRQQAIYILMAATVMALAAGAIAWPGIQNRLWPPEKILAVMPVRSLSGAGDPEPQQLAEALTEETVTALGRLQTRRFRVIEWSPESSSANSVHLDYLLKGSYNERATESR